MSASHGFGGTGARPAAVTATRCADPAAESIPPCEEDPDLVFELEDPPVPRWALDAAAEHDRTDLASAGCADSPLNRDATLAAMRALELCDPHALAEAGHGCALLDGIVAAQRIVARIQALQQRWIAAFSRPGVAVPLGDVVEAAGTSIAEKFGAHLPETAEGETDLCAAPAHPVWGPTVLETASRFAAAEIACATHLAPITARMRLERALQMVDTLPATLAAQEAGLLDGYRAAIIADGVTVLPDALRSQVERKVLATASSCTASELGRRVAHAVIAADPAGAAERAARAVESRHTSVTAIDNDMALFRAILAAPDALTVHGVLDTVATSLTASGRADGRGSAQLRADVFADLFRTLAATGQAHIALPDASAAAGVTCPAAEDARPAACAAQPATGATCPATDDARPGRPTTSAACPAAEDASPAAGPAQRPTGAACPAAEDACSAADPAQPATGIASGCLGGSRSDAEFAPRVSLTVLLDIDTLAGIADHPGEIPGYGSITAGTARALAVSAATVRALVERPVGSPPAVGVELSAAAPSVPPGHTSVHSANAARSRTCGTALDPGRAVYRPPETTADYVRARDRHCQFPGCRARAERCDIDHRVPYQRRGATCPCNLDTLCRAHHRLKTFTAWRAEPDADGHLAWTSPLGNTYTLAPEPSDIGASRVTPARDIPARDIPTRDTAARGTAARGTAARGTVAALPSDADDPPPF